MATAEFREFFLRNVKVTSGTRPDKEIPFPVEYIVNGQRKYNRFLKDHVPSETVFRKLFESITFKLNPDDSATESSQGLSRFASDAEADTGNSGANGSGFIPVLRPHQVPLIADTSATSTATISSKTVRTFVPGGIVKYGIQEDLTPSTTGTWVDITEGTDYEGSINFNKIQLPNNGSRLSFRIVAYTSDDTNTADAIRLYSNMGVIPSTQINKIGSALPLYVIYDGQIVRKSNTEFIIEGEVKVYQPQPTPMQFVTQQYFYHEVTTSNIDTTGDLNIVIQQNHAVSSPFILKHCQFIRMTQG